MSDQALRKLEETENALMARARERWAASGVPVATREEWAAAGGRFCMAENADGFACSRAVGHAGDHVAHGLFEIAARWKGEEEK